jgi:hypothetical protein
MEQVALAINSPQMADSYVELQKAGKKGVKK